MVFPEPIVLQSTHLIFECECSSLQLWQSLLDVRYPTSVEQDWHEVIKKIITDRVKLLPPEVRVDRFLELESRPNTPAVIIDILMTEATTALDEIVFSRRVSIVYLHVHSISLCVCFFIQPTTHHHHTRGNTGYGYSSFDFNKFTHHRSARVVNLLGKILMRKYRNFKDDLQLKDLLEWDLWPSYVSIYGIY